MHCWIRKMIGLCAAIMVLMMLTGCGESARNDSEVNASSDQSMSAEQRELPFEITDDLVTYEFDENNLQGLCAIYEMPGFWAYQFIDDPFFEDYYTVAYRAYGLDKDYELVEPSSYEMVFFQGYQYVIHRFETGTRSYGLYLVADFGKNY